MTDQREKDEALFNEFIDEYLTKVKQTLPKDDRSKFTKGDNKEEYIKHTESHFLREPFFKALEKDRNPEKEKLLF